MRKCPKTCKNVPESSRQCSNDTTAFRFKTKQCYRIIYTVGQKIIKSLPVSQQAANSVADWDWTGSLVYQNIAGPRGPYYGWMYDPTVSLISSIGIIIIIIIIIIFVYYWSCHMQLSHTMYHYDIIMVHCYLYYKYKFNSVIYWKQVRLSVCCLSVVSICLSLKLFSTRFFLFLRTPKYSGPLALASQYPQSATVPNK